MARAPDVVTLNELFVLKAVKAGGTVAGLPLPKELVLRKALYRRGFLRRTIDPTTRFPPFMLTEKGEECLRQNR